MTSLSYGCAFTVAGFALLLGQVVAYDLLRALTALRGGVETAFGHDTLIYPDHA